MAIDGTWARECLLVDVSETGARISLNDGVAELTEFFLVLSAFGGSPVFRRCKRRWINGLLMGVAFHAAPTGAKALKELRRGAQIAAGNP
jgi:hypothetical protein